MLKPKSDPKIIHFQFSGLPTVHSSPEWCLESNILALKHKLGLGIWHSHKILKDYAHPEPSASTAADSSSLSNSSEPALVPPAPKKSRSRKKTPQLQSLPSILVQPDAAVAHEEEPRDLTDGPTDPVSHSLGE